MINKYIEEYKQKMQVVVDKHLTGLDEIKSELSSIQKQNRWMRFTLEFDERGYKMLNELTTRVAENKRAHLISVLSAIGNGMRLEAKAAIQ